MRTFQFATGPCEVCGCHSEGGAYWVNVYEVMDLGEGIPPIEPNMVTPIRCDECDALARHEKSLKTGVPAGGILSPRNHDIYHRRQQERINANQK